MPKYLTRQEFETMKVLRNRKYTIQEIARKMFLAPATVSRNLKYRSYDDYCLSMHAKNTKGGSKVENNSGECRTVGKTCHKCGKAKMLSEFDKRKKSKDGHSTMCKECRKAYQREWERKRKAAEEMERVKFPEDRALEDFVNKITKSEPVAEKETPGMKEAKSMFTKTIDEILDQLEYKTPTGEKIPKFDIGDKVCIRAGFNMSAYGVVNKLLESPANETYYEVKYRTGRFIKKTHTLIAGEDVIFRVVKEK